MPEPQTRRGNVITAAEFEAPFQTPVHVYGMGGLNLAVAIDRVPAGQYTRLTNTYYVPGSGQLTARPGQTSLATFAGADVHSAGRLNDPQNATFTRLWGADADLALGASGAPAVIDTGYSGDPLTLLPHRPPLSGDPWMFVADRLRLRKVRADGLVLPIGLPAGATAVPALGTERRTPVATFFSGSGTEGSAWTGNAGQDFSDPPLPMGAPTITDLATASNFNPVPSGAILAAQKGYYSYWGLARSLDLNTVGGSPATDDDIFQIEMFFGNPALVAECRLYVVVSSVFSASVLPGTQAGVNDDFYVKAFRPGDFASFISAWEDQITAAETARLYAERETSLQRASRRQGFQAVKGAPTRNAAGRDIAPGSARRGTGTGRWASQRDPARDLSKVGSAGTNAVTRYGTIGIPLRRGDFKRYGTTDGRDWGTVTGLVMLLQALPNDPLITQFDPANLLIYVTLSDWALTGGAGPDSMDPATQPYDYRYTHYDPRTGAEGNPSPIMADTAAIDSLRRQIDVVVAGSGDGAVRQRVYRRGGTLNDDWYFVGENTGDGSVFQDLLTDAAIEAAGTVEIDHYQPIATVDDAGNTVLAQPVPILFGPANGMLFALGDPYRPGHLYACIPDEPDHWPPDLVDEVCAPSEELMSGCLYGGQPYVYSRVRGYTVYPNLRGDRGINSAPSGCLRGLASRWGLTVGMGAMWGVATDCVWASSGGQETKVSDEIEPLFRGEPAHGYLPIDFTVPEAIRLAIYRQELWFGYQDTGGDRRVLILNIATKQWRAARFGQQQSAVVAEGTDPTDARLILGGAATSTAYTHEGTADDGAAIDVIVRPGAFDFGRPREEKLYGDQILDLDTMGVDLTLQNFLNDEAVANALQGLTGVPAGRNRAIFDSFGPIPQRARNLATEIAWSTDQPAPVLYQLGTAITVNPDLTINRVTNWDDLGHPDEKYLMGVTFDCDTAGVDRTIVIERDFAGVISTVATLIVNCDGRHKVAFSWPALPANQVRVHPNDDCLAWILYRADWNYQPEPPRIARWDIHFENGWDQYYTGLDLYCDTQGQTKLIVIEVDSVPLINPDDGTIFWPIFAPSRQVVHLTLPWGRGHVFRFYAVDDFPGLLYQHRWHLVEEPSEQANFNEVFTVAGTLADKWIKGVLIEIDTFGQDKVIEIDVDDIPAAIALPTVNTLVRSVVHLSFPQLRGRVLRLYSTDDVACRKYSHQFIFDEEPYGLDRWESQEVDHGLPGYHYLVEGMITIRAEADVTLDIIGTLNQATGATRTESYTIPLTGTAKVKRFVPFRPMNATLYKYLFTSALPFWLYREESHVVVQRFDGGQPIAAHPFGNDDLTVPTRSMISATGAASRSGGGTA
jgi:hypothetical protein